VKLGSEATGGAASHPRRKPLRLAAYTRVSTDLQAERGLGLEVQRGEIQKWAQREGHRVALWTSDEGVSGSNGLDQREGLLDALAAVKEGRVGGLVVARLDRLARDLVLQETLLSEVWRLGGRVYSTSATEDAYLDPDGAEDDPSRQLVRQILGAVAAYERQMIRLRMRTGKARKAAAGGYVGGGIPLGWQAEGGELVEDPAEQAVRKRVLALRAEGLSLRQIGAVLEAEGHLTKRGGERWAPEQVRAVLPRPVEPS
jgi:DNA invertase Pin-like site-specific DNA recombinase